MGNYKTLHAVIPMQLIFSVEVRWALRKVFCINPIFSGLLIAAIECCQQRLPGSFPVDNNTQKGLIFFEI
jgi:hypothetical protein